jgi:hypothetical protein
LNDAFISIHTHGFAIVVGVFGSGSANNSPNTASERARLQSRIKSSFYSFIVLAIKKNTKMAIQPMATLFGDAQKLGKLAQDRSTHTCP